MGGERGRSGAVTDDERFGEGGRTGKTKAVRGVSRITNMHSVIKGLFDQIRPQPLYDIII